MRQDLSTNNMDLKVFISMRELSQILAKVGFSISTFQEEQIQTEVESFSTTPKMTNEPKSKELQKDVLCETAQETDTLGITSKGEHPEIKELSTCKLAYPSFAQTTAQLEEGDLYDIVKEGKYEDYIEKWFHEVTQPQYHSFIRHLLMQIKVSWLDIHDQVITATLFSYVDKGIILILLRTWFHWKNAYT